MFQTMLHRKILKLIRWCNITIIGCVFLLSLCFSHLFKHISLLFSHKTPFFLLDYLSSSNIGDHSLFSLIIFGIRQSNSSLSYFCDILVRISHSIGSFYDFHLYLAFDYDSYQFMINYISMWFGMLVLNQKLINDQYSQDLSMINHDAQFTLE